MIAIAAAAGVWLAVGLTIAGSVATALAPKKIPSRTRSTYRGR